MVKNCSECKAEFCFVCKSCDPTWCAKAHGWHKTSTKKWYCFACSAPYGWVTKNNVDEACAWVCGACKARSTAATESWPDVVASSGSQAATASSGSEAAAGAGSHAWNQDETGIDDLVLVCTCTESVNFPQSSLSKQAPLSRSQLVDMYGIGFFFIEKHCSDSEKTLLGHRPPPIVTFAGRQTGLRHKNDGDWQKDRLTLNSAQWIKAPVVEPAEDLTLAMSSSSSSANIYRWDSTAQQMRSQKVSSQGSCGDAFQISIGTWNGGRYRGNTKSMEKFRAGAWHVVLSQEFDGDHDSIQLQDLEKQHMMCCVRNTSLIAVRDHVCNSIDVLHEEDNDYVQVLIGKVVFKHMLAGLSDLVCGSIHMHNVKVGHKPVVGFERWKRVFDRSIEERCDILAYDANQSIPALFKALRSYQKEAMVMQSPEGDCVGFILPPGSRLLDMPRTQFTCFPYHLADVGWRLRDKDSHHALVATWRRDEDKNKRKRAAASQHNAKRDQARKLRKRENRAPEHVG
jgi:hypothetical protein